MPRSSCCLRVLARRDGGPRWLSGATAESPRLYAPRHGVHSRRPRCRAGLPTAVRRRGTGERRHLRGRPPRRRPDPARNAAPCSTSCATRGLDLEPIPCGGNDPVAQQREQWTDGANAFALAPGVITLYDRNVATADELARRGWRVVDAEDVLLGREEVIARRAVASLPAAPEPRDLARPWWAPLPDPSTVPRPAAVTLCRARRPECVSVLAGPRLGASPPNSLRSRSAGRKGGGDPRSSASTLER